MTIRFDYTHAFVKGQFEAKDLKSQKAQMGSAQNNLRMLAEIDELGFADLPGNANLVASVKQVAKPFKGKIESLVVLGIGGSALGFIALKDALLHPYHNQIAKQKKLPAIYVLDNIDPELVQAALAMVDPATTLVNVITKSGSTAETVGQFLIFYEAFVKKLGSREKANEHFILTTDPKGGPLRALAAKEGFTTLPIPANVGGRFSVMSPVGLFPAHLAGINIDKLLAGAGAYLNHAFQADPLKVPALNEAVINYAHYLKGRHISVMMPYANSLFRVADWYRQLWAESLGKELRIGGQKDPIGPTPVASLGATDQHSQVQLYKEGPDDKLYTFLRVAKMRSNLRYPKSRWNDAAFTYFKGRTMFDLLDAEAEATRFALTEAGRPCITLTLPGIDEDSLGRVLMHYQLQTAVAGLLFDVNAFDQPGVEAGKRYAFGLMGRPGYEDEAKKIGKASKKQFLLEG